MKWFVDYKSSLGLSQLWAIQSLDTQCALVTDPLYSQSRISLYGSVYTIEIDQFLLYIHIS